jgi:hypothetical protein
VQELTELQREGMSIQGISKLTGWDRKIVRKYLLQPNAPRTIWRRTWGERIAKVGWIGGCVSIGHRKFW